LKRIAGKRHLRLVGRWHTGGPQRDRVCAAERVGALGVLQEGVEDLVALDVDAGLDLVVVQEQVARKEAVEGLRVQAIEMAALLGAPSPPAPVWSR
jgi:hypothetical protein